MYYCKYHQIKGQNHVPLPFMCRVDFENIKTVKEDYEPVRIYISQISSIRKQYSTGYLDYNKEAELFKKIEKGDLEAKEEIFNRYIILVPRVVRYYVGNGVQIEDLIQEGNIALLEAINTFDFRKGYYFTTHAKWAIRRRVRLCIPFYLSSFDIPVDSVTTFRKINKLFEQLSMEEFKEHTISSIVNTGFKSTKEVKLHYIMNSFSLDALKFPELESLEDLSTADFTDQVIIKHLVEKIRKVMSNFLTDREEVVVSLLYGLDDGRERTLEEVGRVFGLTRERIRQIQLQALKKLSKYFFV